MTPEEKNTKIDGRTRRAAGIALAKRIISRASYDAILEGRLSLQRAKELGRDRGPTDTAQHSGGPGRARTGRRSASAEGHTGGADAPPQPVSRISKDDRTPTKTPCLCGCGKLVQSLFANGHDMRMFRVAREHLTEGRELTDEQREYLEKSGKLERVRTRLAEEERKRQERITRNTERQRKKEGEAETKRRNEELRRRQEDRE